MRNTRLPLPAIAALALVALYLAAALHLAVERGCERVAGAAEHARETELSANVRLFGAAWAVSLESVRQALAEGEPYLLVDAGEPGEGAPCWVRYALAPRPAVYLGSMGGVLSGHPGLHRLEHETLRHLVVASGNADGPDFYTRDEFLQEIAPSQASHGD
jgi:hypothetical protein